MLKPAVRYGLIGLGAATLVGAVGLGALAWRINSGPISADALRPALERVLATQAPGGHASVGGAEVVWFPNERAAGLRLKDVSLTDAQGRPVLRAAKVETGLSLASIGRLTPAPGRLVARDFFVAASVSREGRYALGYDAVGKPIPIRLETLLRSITGEPRRGKPVSFVRRVDLDDGVVLLRQVGGPVAWRGAVDRISFRKGAGRLSAVAKVSLDDGLGRADLVGRMKGAVGLKDMSASGEVAGLNPARIFPAVGFTRSLAKLDAPVQANGRVQYAADRGITSADVTAGAGQGFLRAGRLVQRLDAARIVTRYDPAAKKVELQTFHLDAERTRLDATGLLWLVPESGANPARVQFEIASNESLLTIASTATPQRISGFTARGRFVPSAGRLEVEDAAFALADAPVRAYALLHRGPDRDEPWGLKATVDIGGTIGPQQAAAFWPEHLGKGARAWFVRSIHTADVTNVRLKADIPPGHFGRRRITNPMFNIGFDFTEAAASITPTLPRIEHAVGSGVVQGDRFDLTMRTGVLHGVALSQGVVEIPRFKPKGVRATFKARAVGDIGRMLEVVDRPPLRLITPTGMSPSRLAGQADLMVEITRPMLRKVPLSDHGVRYTGRWDGGSIRNVGVGLDLDGARMAIDGSLDEMNAKGIGRVGPYLGKIDFHSAFRGPKGGSRVIDLDGMVDVAGAVAGRVSQGAPMKARLTTRKGEGAAVFRSRLLDGRASWTSKRRILVEGVGEPAAWRAAGIPVGQGLPARVPVRLALGGAGGAWSGSLDADAYSGALALTGGASPTVRYVADITPDEARTLGFGDLPLFARTQRVVLEGGRVGRSGSADYAVGGMAGRVDWSPGKEKGALLYRFRTNLDRADLAGLGIPFGPESAMPVDATITGARGGFIGQAQMAGATMRFNVSPQKAGRRQIALGGEAPAATLVRLGMADTETVGGTFDLSGRLEQAPDGRLAGRLEAGMDRASLTIPDSDWRKPVGRKARAFVDLSVKPDGSTSFDRIVAEGVGMELAAAGAVSRGRLVSFDASTVRLDGLFDGAVRAAPGERGLEMRVTGRFLDARPILKRAQRQAGRKGGGVGAGKAQPDPMQLDADLARVRLTDEGYLKDVRVDGTWGAPDTRRLTIAASTLAGSAVSARAWPDKGGTALALKVANLGDAAKSLGGFEDLRGGQATATGRLVPGGYDLAFDVRDVRVARVPALAQLLTVASLQGLADTMNGVGIHFARIQAPVKVRGSQVTLGQTEATGQALGITAKGAVDLDKRTLDVTGVVAPAYALNSAAGNLPVLGPLLVSRKGEGMFGLTYSARGSLDAPRVVANPLSLAAPGVLRRMFEGAAPKATEPDAAPPSG